VLPGQNIAGSAECKPDKENENQTKILGNLMTDPRVYRGNTYALKTTAAPWPTLDPVKARVTIEKAARRKSETSETEKGNREFSKNMRRYEKQISELTKSRLNCSGRNTRKETLSQTEPFLEEIYDKEYEQEHECQTEAIQDRPASPLFTPRKSGIDAETQILENELFDFDIECQPIIENLLGKVMEQALLELMESQELQQLEIQKNGHLERKQVEMVELQRLEAEEARKVAEVEARIEEEKQKHAERVQKRQELAASLFSKKITDMIIPAVMFDLEQSGYFVDPIRTEIEKDFRRDLIEKLRAEHEKMSNIRSFVEEIFKEATENKSEDD